MKRVRAIVIGVIIFGGIVSILLNNRSKITARSRAEILSAVPVSVATATRQKTSENLSLVGTIVANNDVAIVSETQGRVTRVYADVGDYRAAGEPLLQVDDELKKAELEKAEVNFERAKRDLERFKSLRDEHAATELQKDNAWQGFKAAEAQLVIARKQYRDTRITTPISGVVTSRLVDIGSMVSNTMVVANVVDVSRLKVKVNVAEKDAFKLKKGDRVEVTTDVYPGMAYEGSIATISAKADEAHSYPIEIMLPNSTEHPLRAGMFGRVSFVSIADNESLSIPREGLVGSLKQPQVYVVDRSGLAHLRNIVVGGEGGSSLIVLNGLSESETIVVNGQNNLKDSVAVDIVK